LIPESSNTAYSCGQHGPGTTFWSARPGNVIPVPKTSALLGVGVHCRNGIACVKVKFCVLLEFPFVKNGDAAEELHSCGLREDVFETKIKRLDLRVLCFAPINLPLHPAL